jgi:chromosome segregation ATPase
MQEENSEKKDVKKRASKITDSKKEEVNLKSILSENENLKTEIRLLKLKIDAVNDKSYIEGLETEINSITEKVTDKNLRLELNALKLKNSVLEDPKRNKNLEIVVNQLTKEIQDKNEVMSKHLDEIKFKDETISGFQKAILFRDKEIKLLKQTIKDINKKYNDSEEMYEQVSVTLEDCMRDNDKLKLDLIEKKKPIVFEYRLFGFKFFTKTSS